MRRRGDGVGQRDRRMGEEQNRESEREMEDMQWHELTVRFKTREVKVKPKSIAFAICV